MRTTTALDPFLPLSPFPPLSQLSVAWRPLWHLFQSTHLSHVSARARASDLLVAGHLTALIGLIRRASRYFPPSSIPELAAVVAPSFAHLQSHAPFNAQALLFVFLPHWARLDQLPEGTPQHWMRVWSLIDHCASWDAVWAAIFARLAHPARIAAAAAAVGGANGGSSSGGGSGGGGGTGGFAWGAYLPFVTSRLQSLLMAGVPVAGGRPAGKEYPNEARGVLGGHHPSGTDAMAKLLIRLLTVAVPSDVREAYGDEPPDAQPEASPSGEASGEGKKGPSPLSVASSHGSSYVGDASAMGSLERLLRGLGTYFYPTSRNAANFLFFLRCLCTRFAKRVGREAGCAQAAMVTRHTGLGLPGSCTPPLTSDLLIRFVDATLPLAVLGLYAPPDQRGAVGDASRCIRALACVAPARAAKEIGAMAATALDPGTVNQVHQAPNAMTALALTLRTLLWPVPHLGAMLPTLAELALPGIDPNDVSKTHAALAFFSAMLSCVPLVDPADAAEAEARQGSSSAPVELPHWHPASPHYALPALTSSGVAEMPVAPFAGRFLLGGCRTALGPADTPSGLAAATGTGMPSALSGEEGREDEEEDEDMDTDVSTGGGRRGKGGFAPGSAASGYSGPLSDLPSSLRRLYLPLKDEAAPRLAEWALGFLDRVFRVLEAREKPAKAKGNITGAKGGDSLSAWLAWTNALLFAQMSPRLVKAAADRVFTWISGLTSPLDSTKDVMSLLSAVAAAAPDDAAGRFLPLLMERATAAGASSTVRAWSIALADGVSRELGPRLLPHLPKLTSVVKAAYASDDKAVRKAGGKLLRRVLASLLSTYARSLSSSHNPADMKACHTLWIKWGQPAAVVDQAEMAAAGLAAAVAGGSLPLPPQAEMVWHVPSAAEREGALQLIKECLIGPMQRIRDFQDTYGGRTAAASSTTTAGGGGSKAVSPLDASGAGTPTAASSSSSSSGSPSSSFLPVPPSELERLRSDVEMVHAAVRGAVYGLTDGATAAGDDDVIAVGTAGQALVWDEASGTVSYATGASAGPVVSLRHTLLSRTAALLRFLNRHPDLSRDTKALNAATKLGTRLVAGRGPRLSKSGSAVSNIRVMKRAEADVATQARLRQFFKTLRQHAASSAGSGLTLSLSSGGSTLRSCGGLTSQTAPRVMLLARLRIHLQRRVAESIYSIPRALHFGRNCAALGDAQGDAGGGDEAGGLDVDISDLLEEPDVSATRPESPIAAGAGCVTSDADVDMSTASLPSPDLRHAIPAFGRKAVAGLKTEEAPYAVLIAALISMSVHTYDVVRRKAQGHAITALSVFGWLRRPAQLVGLHLLEKDIGTAMAAAAAVRAGALKAAAEAYLSGHPVAPSPSLTHLPPAPPASAVSALPALSLPPSAGAALTSGPPPAALAAMRNQLARLAVAGAAAAAAGGMAGAPSAAGLTASPAAGSLAAAVAAGASPSMGGGAAVTLAGFNALKSPAMAPTAAVAGGKAPSSPPVLVHTDVMGHTFLSFGLGHPRTITRSWPLLERAVNVLLRSGPIIRALATERQAAVLQAFTFAALNLLAAWSAMDTRPLTSSAGYTVSSNAALRDRMLKTLLFAAAPSAYGEIEGDAISSSSGNSGGGGGGLGRSLSTTTTAGGAPSTPTLESVLANLQVVAPPTPVLGGATTSGGGDVTSGMSTTSSIGSGSQLPPAGSPPAPTQQQPAPSDGAPSALLRRGTVMCADGSRAESAAPLPSPGPLHWRYELLAGVWMIILLAPPKSRPLRLAIDSALPQGLLSPTSSSAPRSLEEEGYFLAPEPVWLWALSNVLSDMTPIRAQAVELLTLLLHTRHEAACAGHDVVKAYPLPRVTSCLSNPAYWSQLVMSLALDHPDALAAAEGGAGPLASGMHEMLKPLECAETFLEYARVSLKPSAVSLIHHMILFQLLASTFPSCLPPALAALSDLAAASKTKAASSSGAGAGAAASSGEAMEVEGETDNKTPQASPPAAAAGRPSASTSASISSGHEASTLRVRQATVAEALGGFLRALSGLKTPGTSPGVDGGPAGNVRFSMSDASLTSLGAAVAASPSPSTTTASGSPEFFADADGLMLRVLEVAAPILETVGQEHTADWYNAIRFACRQRHPSQLALLCRYVLANAAASLAAGDAASLALPTGDGVTEPAVNAAFLSAMMAVASEQHARAGAAAADAAAPAGATAEGGATSSTVSSSFAAQSRWLQLSCALLEELLVTSDGYGPSGLHPGVTHTEEAGRGHASLRTKAEAAADFASEAGVQPSRQAATSLVRQLLPSVLRCLSHRFKPVREGVADIIGLCLENTWAAADAAGNGIGGADVTTSALPARQTPNGAEGVERVMEAPPSCGRMQWAPAVLAYMLHCGLAALRKSAASGAASSAAASSSSSGSPGHTAASSTSSSSTAGQDDRWDRRVLETLLLVLHSVVEGDGTVVGPVLASLLPVLLQAQNHPERELAAVASHVLTSVSQNMSMARVDARDGAAEAGMYAALAQAVGSRLPSASLVSAALPALQLAPRESLGSPSPAAGGAALTRQVPSNLTGVVLSLLEELATLGAKAVKGDKEEGGGADVNGAPAGTPTATSVSGGTPKEGASTVATTAAGAGWYTRRAVLAFLTPLRAHGLMTLSRAEDALVTSLVEARLSDGQIEVQEAAADALVGLLMTMPIPVQCRLSDAYLALAATKLPKRVPAPTSTATPAEVEAYRKYKQRQAKAVGKRHAGVLGVGAVIKVSPRSQNASLGVQLA